MPDFFRIPPEVRTQIYEELLVDDDLITLKKDPHRPHTIRRMPPALYPAPDIHPQILRVNKQIYREALAILYARNGFYIPLSYCPSNKPPRRTPFLGQPAMRPPALVSDVEPFFREIGYAQAARIRRLCILFPDVLGSSRRRVRTRIQRDHDKNLQRIRDACPALEVLEMNAIMGTMHFDFSDGAAMRAVVGVVKERLASFKKLKKVVVRLMCSDHYADRAVVEALTEQGWTVEEDKYCYTGHLQFSDNETDSDDD